MADVDLKFVSEGFIKFLKVTPNKFYYNEFKWKMQRVRSRIFYTDEVQENHV